MNLIPWTQKRGRGRAQANFKFRKFMFLCSRSQEMKSENVSKLLITSEPSLIYSKSTYAGLPFIFFKSINSGHSFYFPRKLWKMKIYIKSKLWRFMVILPRLKPVDGGYQPSQSFCKCFVNYYTQMRRKCQAKLEPLKVKNCQNVKISSITWLLVGCVNLTFVGLRLP